MTSEGVAIHSNATLENSTPAAVITTPLTAAKVMAVCTVSDHIITGEATTAEERQNTFTDMMKLALETAIIL